MYFWLFSLVLYNEKKNKIISGLKQLDSRNYLLSSTLTRITINQTDNE